MWKLLLQIAAGILGIFLAGKFVPGVSLEIIPGQSSFLGLQITAFWQILLIVGAVLGLINFFVKPALKAVTLPLRIITFGLFALVINILIVWVVDILFLELDIEGIIPLFWTSLIISLLSFFLPKWLPDNGKRDK